MQPRWFLHQMCVNTSDNVQTEPSRCILWLFTLPALFIRIPVSFTVYTTSIVLSVKCFSIILTLSSLSLRDPLSDYPTGIIDGCGGLELHRLHNVALANADFQRQHHHLGRRCGRGLQLHLHKTRTERGRTEQERLSLLRGTSPGGPQSSTVVNEPDVGGEELLFCCYRERTYISLTIFPT